MNKIFFDDENDFIDILLKNYNNIGIVYCDSFRKAAYIRNEILKIISNNDKLKDNYINNNNNYIINTITLKNNSSIMFLSKSDSNINYRIRGITIDRILFKEYPNDDFFKYVFPLIRNINNE